MPDDLGTLKRNYGNLPPPPHDFGQQPNAPAPTPPPPPDEPPPWASLPEAGSAPPPPQLPNINPNWLKRLRRDEE